MIHVRRIGGPPQALRGVPAQRAFDQAQKHFASEEAHARQEKFKFKPVYRDAEIFAELGRVFSDKCAFCESAVGVDAAPIVHHFRPKQEAIDEDGGVSRLHYWWLAYTWENLYLACQRCATAAGERFPVESRRARPFQFGRELIAEEHVLLDPCLDSPDEHLEFAESGIVNPKSNRGEATVRVFGLNRAPLIEARAEAIENWARRGRPAVDPSEPYAAAILSARRSGTPAVPDRPAYGWVLASAFAAPVRFYEHLASAVRRLVPGGPQVEPVVVERLELCDFRGIEDLVLDLSDPGDEAPWTVLLGENGQGKTTVLQALALLLAGPRAWRRLPFPPQSLIRRGASKATVTAWVRGEVSPFVLRIESDGMKIAAPQAAAALAAYGAARIPALGRRARFRNDKGRPRVENLFDPAAPLIDAERWLQRLDPEAFDYAARALMRLLLAPDGTKLHRGEHGIVLVHRATGETTPLRGLSDGYRSMIALAADLMSFFMGRFGSMDAAEGIVLVDEISAHLHPRWQMRVVGALREAFPRLQFVVTTHDPLCLRGLSEPREVVVLRRTGEGEIYALPTSEVPPLRGLRVDALLTSEVFGLNSTLDPSIEQLFDDYYELLGSHRRDAESEQRIAALKQELDQHRQLGSTRRERLALEAADEYLAREVDVSSPPERADLLEETKERLRAIWANEG